MEAQEHSTEPV